MQYFALMKTLGLHVWISKFQVGKLDYNTQHVENCNAQVSQAEILVSASLVFLVTVGQNISNSVLNNNFTLHFMPWLKATFHLDFGFDFLEVYLINS